MDLKQCDRCEAIIHVGEARAQFSYVRWGKCARGKKAPSSIPLRLLESLKWQNVSKDDHKGKTDLCLTCTQAFENFMGRSTG